MICGKPYDQIGDEVVIANVLTSCTTHNTRVSPITSKRQGEERSLKGMHAGTYLLIPRGVSQTAAYDGNVYADLQRAIMTIATPSNLLPL